MFLRGHSRGDARRAFLDCYDHDDDCRRAVGSPLSIWVGYRPDQFRLKRGTPQSFSKTNGIVRTFCANCGTSISYLDEGLNDEFYLTIGFLDQPERFQPQGNAYWRMKLPWLEFADGLPRTDGYSRQRDPAFGDPKDRLRRKGQFVRRRRARYNIWAVAASTDSQP